MHDYLWRPAKPNDVMPGRNGKKNAALEAMAAWLRAHPGEPMFVTSGNVTNERSSVAIAMRNRGLTISTTTAVGGFIVVSSAPVETMEENVEMMEEN